MISTTRLRAALAVALFSFSFINVSAAVAQDAEATVTLKKKVAIARFSNETRSGQSFLVDDNNDRIGKQASDILSARLAETGVISTRLKEEAINELSQ